MKRIPALVGGVLATLVLAAPAQADPISWDYCEHSLRGGGSLAPDNDIKAYWDLYENATGLNIASSSRSAAGWVNAQYVQMHFTFFNGAGQPLTGAWFRCWRENFSTNGQYHDSVM